MTTMKARHKVTKAVVTGTFEKVDASAYVTFTRDEAGNVEWEHTGESEVFWDGMTTQFNEAGNMLFLLDDGEECTIEEIEYYDPNEAADDAEIPPF